MIYSKQKTINYYPSKALVVLLFSVFLSKPAYSVDLVLFGKECLKEEHSLKKTKDTFEEKALQLEIKQANERRISQLIDSYTQEISNLDELIASCKETKKAICKQAKIRYEKLVALKKESEDKQTKLYQLKSDSTLEDLYNRYNYEVAFENFIGYCRNSNLHYQMINNSDAYQAVCIDTKAKESLTCSLL